MISSEKIDEWLQEVEERPASAPILLRFIANRLRDLTQRNEELLAENIELRLGKKVEEYESRIANLEYQLELLKRQIGGEAGSFIPEPAGPEAAILLLFNRLGQVLKVGLGGDDLVSGREVAVFQDGTPGGIPVRLLATRPREELLFVFDSGRTVTMPVSDVPGIESGTLDWEKSQLQEPRGDEELAAILPIARMSLSEFCLQISRRGFVKKIRENFFEGYVSAGYVGTGVKTKSDQTFNLVFAAKEDQLVLATKEGYLLALAVDDLPLTIEEVLRLSPSDHVIGAFAPGNKPSFLGLTQNGKAIHREIGWIESGAIKTRGQPVFSKERREAGTRLVGAAAVDREDWGAGLSSEGRLDLHRIGDILGAGSWPLRSGELAAFTTFSAEVNRASSE